MRVLVVGAGIGGLTAGAALAQRGTGVGIVELKPAEMSLGVGLVLPPNALPALLEIGVLDECLSAGFAFNCNRFCDPDGQLLVEVPGLIGRRDGLPSLALHRSDLHQVLTGAVKNAGVGVAYGTTVSDVVCDDGGAHVSLSDGRTGTYDLVIGFDGINSVLRRRVACSTGPRHLGFATSRVTAPRVPELTCGTLFMGLRTKAGLNPLSDDEMYLFATSPEPAHTPPIPDRLHDDLRERLDGYRGLLGAVLHSLTRPGGVVYSPGAEVPVTPSAEGRGFLAGGAAHPTAPDLTPGPARAVRDA